MKNLFYIIIALFIVSCSSPSDEARGKKVHLGGLQKADQVKTSDEDKPYENPNLIYGSNFGIFFQSMYKIGDFDQMLKFTSTESKSKHGEDELVKFYQTMNFGFEMKPNAIKSIDDSTYVLSFKTLNYATRNIRRMKVTVENDSCKVVLPDDLSLFMSGREVIETR